MTTLHMDSDIEINSETVAANADRVLSQQNIKRR